MKPHPFTPRHRDGQCATCGQNRWHERHRPSEPLAVETYYPAHQRIEVKP